MERVLREDALQTQAKSIEYLACKPYLEQLESEITAAG